MAVALVFYTLLVNNCLPGTCLKEKYEIELFSVLRSALCLKASMLSALGACSPKETQGHLLGTGCFFT